MRSPSGALRVEPLLWLLAAALCACSADPVVVLRERDAGFDAATRWINCACEVGSTIGCWETFQEADTCKRVVGVRTCLPDAGWGPCEGEVSQAEGPSFVSVDAGADCTYVHMVCGPVRGEGLDGDCSMVSECDAGAPFQIEPRKAP